MPRYCSTVLIASAGPPIAYAALILSRPWPGMSTIVSRGIDSRPTCPPPTRMSMIESERLGLADRVRARLRVSAVRWSEPSTRIVFGDVSGKPAPPSARSAASVILPAGSAR